MRKTTSFLFILCGILSLAFCTTQAVDFPTKEIRIIVPYKAGGQSDLAARKIAELAQKKNILPQTVLVVNMSGANTLEGLRALRDAKPAFNYPQFSTGYTKSEIAPPGSS